MDRCPIDEGSNTDESEDDMGDDGGLRHGVAKVLTIVLFVGIFKTADE
jgi:hypothetical protein